MDKDFSADFDSEALPSIATLERYIEGGMADDERERLEAQIAKDPLLADAVDGLRMSQGDSDMAARMSRIRSRVSSSVEAIPQPDSISSKRKSRVKPFPQYLVYAAVAAGFALLLVFVGLMRNGEHSEEPQNPDLITQNQPIPSPETEEVIESQAPGPATQPVSPVSEESPEPPTHPPLARSGNSEPNNVLLPEEHGAEDNDGLADIIDEEEDFGTETGDDIVAPAPQPVPEPTDPNTTYSTDSEYEFASPVETASSQSQRQELEIQAGDLAKLAQEAVQEESEITREPTIPAASPVSSSAERPRRRQNDAPQADFTTEDLEYQREADQTAGAVSKAQLMADLLIEAIRLHENNKLDSANLLLDEVLLSEPENVVASYYKGMSLVDQEKFDEAIPFLSTATEVGPSAVFEEARWQLANAYYGAGKKRKARVLLTTISEDSGKYQTEAETLLQNMD